MTESIKKDTAILEGFQCDDCGEFHKELPRSLAFSMPDYVNKLLPWDRESRCEMTEDWCIVDKALYYVRGCLEIPVTTGGAPFVWGVWTTISEQDFDATMELWNDPERVNEPEYIGTLSNTMPFYPETRSLKTLIRTNSVSNRPSIIIDVPRHPLHQDQQNGCTRERIIEFAKLVLHGQASNPYGHLCER